MVRFQDLPIRRKLVAMMLLTSMTVLLAAAAAMVAYEFRSYRLEMAARLSAMAAVIANNSAAVLAVDEPELGYEILASLRFDSEISSAALYDAEGNLHTVFPTNRPIAEFPRTLAEGEPAGFRSQHFILYAPVVQGNRQMGTVLLKGNFQQMYLRLANYGLILVLVLFGGGLLAVVLANLIEGRISYPLLELTKVAKVITRKQDYAVRAVAWSKDELGYLTRAFNSMLDQIQARDSKLRDSEKRFREMIDALPAAVYTTDAAGRITHFNPAAIQLAGHVPELGTIDWWAGWKLAHADGAPMAFEQFALALGINEHRPGESTEFIVERPDGTRTWVAPYPTPIYDADGRFTGGINMLVNVTHRREAEAALRERDERYELVVAGAEAAIWDWDIPRQRVLYSPRWRQLRGLAESEVSDSEQEWLQGIHPDDRERVLAAVQAHMDGRTAVFAEEYRIRHKDGHWLWILDRGLVRRDTNGVALRMAGSETDISERKRAEQSLRESEERFARFMQHLPGLAWIKDLHGRYVYANSAAADVFGLSLEKLYGRTDEELFPPDIAAQFKANDQAALASAGGIQVVEEMTHTDGALHHSIVSKFPIPGADGRPALVGGVAVDITERKRAEEALRRSEIKYRSIFEGVAVSLWEEDFSELMAAVTELKAQGVRDFRRYCAEHPEFIRQAKHLIRVRDVNDCTLTMFEAKEKTELLGPLPDIFEADAVPALIEEIQALARGDNFFQGEAVLRTLRKNPIHVLFSMSLPPGSQEYDRVLFSVIDITRRIQVEQALQDSERRFRMIADNISVLAWAADPQGVRTWYNRRWFEYTGLTLDGSPGRAWQQLLHPNHFARVNHNLQDALSRGVPWEETFPLRGRDGQYRWFLSRVVPIFDDRGNILRWFGTNVDVTDLREAQQSVARLAEIVESSQDAIISKSTDGIIQTWNRAAERMFGYGAQEAVGRSITMLYPPERQAEEEAILERQRRGERIEHFETIRVHKDGTRIEVSLSVSPIRNSSGEVVGVSKIARDISEKKRAERELERALAAAESANRSKDEFLAALSHELRTPLMPVLFTISVWQQDPSLPANLRANLAVIRRNIEIQARMINDLLDLSRIRSNRLELTSEIVDLHEVLGRALEVCRSHPKYGALSIALELEAQTCHVRGDPDRLQQVFWNLIQNAVKFTPPGGKITIASRNRAEAVCITVSDTGCGIDASLLNKVFEPFEQCGRKGKESLQGLGLGLAIAQRIIAAHGGSLSAASAGQDLGAIFSLELQTVPAPSPDARSTEPMIMNQPL
jgi:PAS domain S-box-containing protein